MKRAYLAVISVITVICVIVGLARNVHRRREIVEAEEYETADAAVYGDEYEPEEDRNDGTVTGAAVTLAAGSVEIVPGDSFSVSESGIRGLEWGITDDGFLNVWQEDGEMHSADRTGTVTITLPADDRMESLDVSVEVGSIDIRDIETESMSLNCALGDVSAENLYAVGGSITVETGNANLSGMRFDTMDVHVSLGNISFMAAQDLTDLAKNFSVDLGSVSINGAQIGKSIETGGEGSGSLALTCHMGNIEVTW